MRPKNHNCLFLWKKKKRMWIITGTAIRFRSGESRGVFNKKNHCCFSVILKRFFNEPEKKAIGPFMNRRGGDSGTAHCASLLALSFGTISPSPRSSKSFRFLIGGENIVVPAEKLQQGLGRGQQTQEKALPPRSGTIRQRAKDDLFLAAQTFMGVVSPGLFFVARRRHKGIHRAGLLVTRKEPFSGFFSGGEKKRVLDHRPRPGRCCPCGSLGRAKLAAGLRTKMLAGSGYRRNGKGSSKPGQARFCFRHGADSFPSFFFRDNWNPPAGNERTICFIASLGHCARRLPRGLSGEKVGPGCSFSRRSPRPMDDFRPTRGPPRND